MGKFNDKRKYQYNVIQSFIKNNPKVSISKLSDKLNTDRKTTSKLLEQYYDGTMLTIQHGHTGTIKQDKELKESIVEFYKNTLISLQSVNSRIKLNFNVFYELFLTKELKEKVCKKTMHNYLLESGIYSPRSNRSTKRRIRKEARKDKTIQQVIKILDKYEKEVKTRPYYGKNDLKFGEVVELDACQDFWFNDEKYHLYSAIDASTSLVLAIHIEKEETTNGYYILLRKLMKLYGKPMLIKTDKRRSFWNNVDTQSLMEVTLNELGIMLQCDSCPTFKPHVERMFEVMQDWIPVLAAKENITTLESFKDNYEIFIKALNYNKTKKINYNESYFIPIKDEEYEMLYPKIKVRMNNNLYFSIGGKAYAPFGSDGKRHVMKNNSYLMIINNVDKNEMFTIFKGKRFEIREVSQEDIFADEWSYIQAHKLKLEQEKWKLMETNRHVIKALDERERRLTAAENKLKSLGIDI